MNNVSVNRYLIKQSNIISIILVCVLLLGSLFVMPSYSSAKVIRPKKIVMNKKSVKLAVDDTFRLKVKKVSPKGASKAVAYSSSDKKIVKVSKKGLIKALNEGRTTITVRSKKAKKVSAKVKVKVTATNGNGGNQPAPGTFPGTQLTPDTIPGSTDNPDNPGVQPTSSAAPDNTDNPDNPGVQPTSSAVPDNTDNPDNPDDKATPTPDVSARDEAVTLYKSGEFCAPIIVDRDYDINDDPYSDRTYTQIMNAISDLRQDIAMVSGGIDYREIQNLFEDDEESQENRLDSVDGDLVPKLMYDYEVEAYNPMLQAGAGQNMQAYTGKTTQAVTDLPITSDTAIIVGSIKNSLLIRSIIKEGKLEEAKKIRNLWEGYLIKTVHDVYGFKNVLVIAGSDARGTIYGIYTLSEMIGVSPFYWFSDVPVEHKTEITINPGSNPAASGTAQSGDVFTSITTNGSANGGTDYGVIADNGLLLDKGPAVKYRGIFINDEEKTIEWCKEKFPSGGWYTPSTDYYRHVFELILRLKANTLWPAMHDVSRAFNRLTDENGIPVNAKAAADYGIIMGTSHCEIMLRNNVDEWWTWFEQNKDNYPNVASYNDNMNAYDFSINRDVLVGYWKERLTSNQDFENILTLGIRGIHDSAFLCADLAKYEGITDSEKKVNMMKDVITTQREIIAEIYGEDNVDKIPQVIIPYNEMNDIYNNGLDKFLLWDGSRDFNNDGVINYKDDNTDIMIMWAEDNHNYLRQDLSGEEASRRGGAGIYYHISYWGPPQSYLWLNSTSIYTMAEQMHRGYGIGADDYWILNVGDIKPSEPSTEYFMKMAWDPKAWDERSADIYLKNQAMRDYGMDEESAADMADLVSEYYQINGVRKAEFYSKAWFGNPPRGFSSYEWGDEALRWIRRSNANVSAMTKLYNNNVRKIYRNAFYEQFYFNMLTLNDIIETFGYYEKNQLAGSQGRYMSSRVYADLSGEAQNRMIARVDEANALNNAKWNHMYEYDHPGRQYCLLGDGGETYSYVSKPVRGVGAACENSRAAGRGTLYFNALIPGETHYIDVFSKNVSREGWSAKTSTDWIRMSADRGMVRTEDRIRIWIDPVALGDALGTRTGTITIYDDYGNTAGIFTVNATVPEVITEDVKGYVCADGYVAFEAEHFSDNVIGEDGTYWALSHKTGQNGDTMKAMPYDAGSPGNSTQSGHLVYNVYFENAGAYNFGIVRRPVLNEGSENGNPRSMGVAVRVDDNRMVTLTGTRTSGNFDNIVNMSETLKSTISVHKGWNKIAVYISDAGFLFDRIYIEEASGIIGNSILGPPESPNTFGGEIAGGTYDIAAIPSEVTDYSREEVVLDDIRNVRVGYDESVTVDIPAHASNGAVITLSAESDRTDLVTVRVADGGAACQVILTGVRPVEILDGGSRTATITVTATAAGCESAWTTFKVNVYDPLIGSIYEMPSGVPGGTVNTLIINAQDALNESYHAWTDTIEPNEWIRSGNGIKIIPDVGKNYTERELDISSSVNFRVKVPESGQYYLYVNMSSPDVESDSYHFAVDGKYVYTQYQGDLSGNDRWNYTGQAFYLSAGEHVLSIYEREDGFVLNKIALTNGLRDF